MSEVARRAALLHKAAGRAHGTVWLGVWQAPQLRRTGLTSDFWRPCTTLNMKAVANGPDLPLVMFYTLLLLLEYFVHILCIYLTRS